MKLFKGFITATFILIFSSWNFCEASDSCGVRSISVGYYMLNDNDPVSNQKGYDARNRDDHGLTFLYRLHAEAELQLFKNTKTTIRFENYCGLFTRDMSTISTIKSDDPDYSYFSYILAKHPDWDNVLLYNQSAITKNMNSLSFSNNMKNIIYGVSFKLTKIDSDDEQRGTNIQHWFHKSLKVRNFYHKPFSDSTIFKGAQFSYFSASLFGGYNKLFDISPKFSFSIAPQLGLWYNFTNKYTIVPFSPYAKLNASFNFGRTIYSSTKRFGLTYDLYYEPNERLQLFSDPGTQGNHSIGLSFNFAGKKKSKIEECKTWFMMYKLSAFSYHMPIGLKKDNILNYTSQGNDKRTLMGLINLTAVLVLK